MGNNKNIVTMFISMNGYKLQKAQISVYNCLMAFASFKNCFTKSNKHLKG